MTKEKRSELNRMKNDFIKEMQIEVETDAPEKMDERLSNQIQLIKRAFKLKFPDTFERFYEDFETELDKEVYQLRRRYIENTTKNIESDISEKIDVLLEESEQGKTIDGTQTIDKKTNYERQENIERALQTAFKNGILSLNGRILCTRDDIEELIYALKNIIEEYSQTIEKEVFSYTEIEITQKQVKKYIQQLNQDLEKDELQWEDEKSICPKLTPESQAQFAERTKQIATDTKRQDEDIRARIKYVQDLVM